MTTSNGVLPKTLAAPAIRPKAPVTKTGTGSLGPLREDFLLREEKQRQVVELDDHSRERDKPILFFESFHHVEANCLVRSLLEHGGCEALIRASKTFRANDFSHAVKKSSIVRFGQLLIVNEFHFDRFHRCDSENRLGQLKFVVRAAREEENRTTQNEPQRLSHRAIEFWCSAVLVHQRRISLILRKLQICRQAHLSPLDRSPLTAQHFWGLSHRVKR